MAPAIASPASGSHKGEREQTGLAACFDANFPKAPLLRHDGPGQAEMLYYNNRCSRGAGVPMPTDVHPQHHHHPPGEGHPPASVAPSILRLSVLHRLALAAAVIALIWGAVIWAMQA